MGFWQKQQKQAAAKFLHWRYQKEGRDMPGPEELDRQAESLVEEARLIAKRTGRNILGIIRELVNDLKK